MGLIRDGIPAAARRRRGLTAAGVVALAGPWVMWRKTRPGMLPQEKAFSIRHKGIAGAGRPANASRLPARSRAAVPQDRSRKRNTHQRPPWAGQALAGGFGPRPVLIPA
ncbi:MAG: hypothetical protein IOC71_13965 [Rhodobacter sp.]|nr:hypothetical protein [Rhodobacter sp.]